jgi:hypothetical protein
MGRSRWNWILLPVGFTIAYALTWSATSLPLHRAWTGSQKRGDFFSMHVYWVGEVSAYFAIQIFSSIILAVICSVAVPTARRKALIIGGLTGVATALLDWLSARASFVGSPLVVGGVCIALLFCLRLAKDRNFHGAMDAIKDLHYRASNR